ncbi:hypothetical protein [Priestia megaterium]|uniref:hypothetical protein n=1 Tax=Priestia megaterium TaxID=1404 RepID=UPI00114F3A2B|nr:hypothetical protein [Priestia aryabhattai]MDH3135528.1 hypothetical protein [Priestia aryabhattai]
MTNLRDLSYLLSLLQQSLLQKKRKRPCPPEPCCCCCYSCPQPPIPNPCPNPTLPNEPPECETRRQTFANFSPYFRFDLNLFYYFFNDLSTFEEAHNHCAMLGTEYRPPTIQEFNAIKNDFDAAGLCTMLVWVTTIVNGRQTPTLVSYVPGQSAVIVPTPSLFCRGYVVCVAPIE